MVFALIFDFHFVFVSICCILTCSVGFCWKIFSLSFVCFNISFVHLIARAGNEWAFLLYVGSIKKGIRVLHGKFFYYIFGTSFSLLKIEKKCCFLDEGLSI